MAKRGLWLLAGLFLVAILVIIYLHYSYFFNPLTFKQSEITHLPWRWYRNPLQLQYAVLEDDGWKMITITDQAEIDLVFRELQKGVGHAAQEPDEIGCRVWLGVRRQGDGVILLSVDGREQATTFQLRNETEVIVTERLQLLLRQRLEEARTGAAGRAVKVET